MRPPDRVLDRRSVGVHLWASSDGRGGQVPLHCTIGDKQYNVTAASAPDDSGLTPFGDPSLSKQKHAGGAVLQLGQEYTVRFDAVGDQLTITFLAVLNQPVSCSPTHD